VTSSIGVDALFAQSGVVACRDAHDLVSTGLLLTQQPLPGGARLGVVSNAGGLGVLAADVADASGLVVPELSPELSARIGLGVTGTVGIGNPVDLGAGVTAAGLAAALTPLLASDEVDAVVVILVATAMTESGSIVATLADLRATAPDKPVLLVTYGDIGTEPLAPAVTVFDSTQAALGSLAHAVRYAAWLRAPRGEPAPTDPVRAAASADRAAGLLAASSETGGWLTPGRVAELLAPYELDPAGRVGNTAEEAVATADLVGYPVAVKAADPRVVHKSDRGLVRLALQTPDEVRAAVADFGSELGSADVPVMVQPMLTGVELALGLVRDPTFGPLVMVAAGGVDIDVWDDRVFLLPPVSRQDAARALRALRIWPVLRGHRGRPAADLDGIERRLTSLGRLALDVPQIAELDLNPVLVGHDHASVVDAKVRLDATPPVDAGVPRRLRG
jgi:acyl-CoA synthetase (NDP forming)